MSTPSEVSLSAASLRELLASGKLEAEEPERVRLTLAEDALAVARKERAIVQAALSAFIAWERGRLHGPNLALMKELGEALTAAGELGWYGLTEDDLKGQGRPSEEK